jgi:hypothetical protein
MGSVASLVVVCIPGALQGAPVHIATFQMATYPIWQQNASSQSHAGLAMGHTVKQDLSATTATPQAVESGTILHNNVQSLAEANVLQHGISKACCSGGGSGNAKLCSNSSQVSLHACHGTISKRVEAQCVLSMTSALTGSGPLPAHRQSIHLQPCRRIFCFSSPYTRSCRLLGPVNRFVRAIKYWSDRKWDEHLSNLSPLKRCGLT